MLAAAALTLKIRCVQVYEVRQYPKSPRYSDLLPIVGPESMLLTEGHVWKSQRESFNPGRGILNPQSTFPFVTVGSTTASSLMQLLYLARQSCATGKGASTYASG